MRRRSRARRPRSRRGSNLRDISIVASGVILSGGIFVNPFFIQAEEFLKEHPGLSQFIDKETDSPFRVGIGISPVAVVRGAIVASLNIFQLHYQGRYLDYEIFSAFYSVAISDPNSLGYHAFTFRTVPKFPLLANVSIGPLLGYEYVSFGNVGSQITSNNLYSPVEPFSNRGWIFGLMITETFQLTPTFVLKANQLIYRETYSTTTNPDGWTYYFPNNQSLNSDASPIAKSTVFMLEFSVVF